MTSGDEFGQLVEYVTEGPVFHRIALSRHDWNSRYVIEALLEDYIKVFRIVERVLDLDDLEFSAVIPAAVRERINVWLTNRDYPTIPDGWTYRQLLVAIRNRVLA